jgi:hypothetical protein
MRALLSCVLLASCVVPPGGGGGYVAAPQPQAQSESAPEPAYTTYGAPQQECKSEYGTTACGYGCVAAYGEVKCAPNPGGACNAAYGQVTCSEGTPVAGYYGAPPQQECKSAYGTTACGYGCVAAYGEVKCASQPGGTCGAAYGQVTCSN